MTTNSRDAKPLADTVYKTADGELGFRRELTFSGNVDDCPDCGAPSNQLLEEESAVFCMGCQSFISILERKTTITIRK